ncbi:MAG: hypothetical protein ACRCTY_05645, partial [Candidatus Adiutrix sp.]
WLGLPLDAPKAEMLRQVDYSRLRPLMDEMLACCYRIDGGIEQRCLPETVGGYIEDVKTIMTLRQEALKLNLGFTEPKPESGFGSPEKVSIAKTPTGLA